VALRLKLLADWGQQKEIALLFLFRNGGSGMSWVYSIAVLQQWPKCKIQLQIANQPFYR